MRFNWPESVYIQSILLGLASLSLIFGGIFSTLDKRSGKGFYIVLTIMGLGLGYWSLEPLLNSGEDSYPVNRFSFIPTGLTSLDLPNPDQKGTNTLQYFTYGSGTDKRRPEFNKEVQYQTEPVDASLLLPEWTGKKKKVERKILGFWDYKCSS